MKKLNQYLDYSQPNFYHFSDDSTFLAKFVYSELKSRLKNTHLLDLCCGCGIVGLELLYKSKNSFSLDFIEIQPEFFNHIKVNCTNYFPKSKFLIEINDFRNLKNNFFNSYDYIVCNPPYYTEGSKRLSANKNKNICKHFLKGDYNILISSLLKLLKKEGEAYFIFPSGIIDLTCFTSINLNIEIVSSKKDVDLFRLRRLNKDINHKLS